MEPVITVVVPVHPAHYYYLPRALESIKSSTVPAATLVVHDGPGSLTIPYPTLETGGDKGTAYARNRALERVDTELVTFLDADDILIDNGLEALLRGYAEYPEACYTYGDWYQFGKGGELAYHEAKPYDRQRLIRHTIHTVTILLTTEAARQIPFDESYRGWEDYAWFIELAAHGYCGTKVPYPVMVYDMLSSINRERHDKIEKEVYPELIAKYKEVLDGKEQFMACGTCGGKSAARKAVNVLPPAPEQGKVLVEYVGTNQGVIQFKVNGNVYKGANEERHKYAQAAPTDVEELLAKGPWRKVIHPTRAPNAPSVKDLQEFRRHVPARMQLAELEERLRG